MSQGRRLFIEKGAEFQQRRRNPLSPIPVLFVVGFVLIVEAVAMTIPMMVGFIYGTDSWIAFGLSAALTGFAGGALVVTCWQSDVVLSVRQTFMLTTLCWLAAAFFGSLPFHFGVYELSETDAFFETMSGLTTTGSTVLVGLDEAPRAVLLWRSLLQWMGGIGIIAMAIVILPFLRVGGMQLFQAERSDEAEKVLPRMNQVAFSILLIYVALTAACTLTLIICGMPIFDSINHAMTTLSTGGFSTSDASIGGFNLDFEWPLIIFMIAGSLPFLRYVAAVRGDWLGLWRDSQIRNFLLFIVLCCVMLAAWMNLFNGYDFLAACREAIFSVTSIVSTTGFVSADYEMWGSFAVTLFLMLTFVGGCTGSTSGGIKIYRFEILGLAFRGQRARLLSPHRVIRLNYQGKPIDPSLLVSVMGLLFLFLLMWLLVSLILAAMGLDILTATSGAATALANVGPGLGPIIGPAGSFGPLPDAAKWVLAFAMLLGRLEFFAVLILLAPEFWRR
ncbi:MAG: TrkH family potassium uptake protein [Pseudomonadota bacterium]